MNRPRRIIVTGASGFIGRHLTRALLNDGHEVLGLTRSRSGADKVPKGARCHITDYSAQDLSEVFTDYDSMVHLAARRSTREDTPGAMSPFLKAAGDMLDALLTAATTSEITKIVTMSSIAVYSSANNAPYVETDFPMPLNPYGLSKLVMEYAVDLWARTHGAEVTHLRLAACYGEGEKATGALMRFAEQARAKDRLNVTNGGGYQIDQIYVEDAVGAILSALIHAGAGPVNVGSGIGYSVLEIAKAANKAFDNSDQLTVEPATLAAIVEVQRHMRVDKAAKCLKWEPEYCLEKGLLAMSTKQLNHNIETKL